MGSSFTSFKFSSGLVPAFGRKNSLQDYAHGKEMRSGAAGSWDSGSPFLF